MRRTQRRQPFLLDFQTGFLQRCQRAFMTLYVAVPGVHDLALAVQDIIQRHATHFVVGEAHPDDLVELTRQMVLLGKPQSPTALMLHEAQLDHVAFLVPDLLRPPAHDTLQIRLEGIGVPKKRAGVDHGHAHTGTEESDLVTDRVPVRRRRFCHMNLGARLVVTLLVLDGEVGPVPLPEEPERLPIPDEGPTSLAVGTRTLDAKMVRLLQPDRIGAVPQFLPSRLPAILALIRQGRGLTQRRDYACHPKLRLRLPPECQDVFTHMSG